VIFEPVVQAVAISATANKRFTVVFIFCSSFYLKKSFNFLIFAIGNIPEYKQISYQNSKMAKELTTKEENYSQWYNDLVSKADLAENSAVRGCMVIKPYGYAIWEKMQAALDQMFKETGHENAYFPLFIPKSFFSKEASHVDGFAKECAVVTHYRLKNDPNGKGIIVDPDAKLEEELIIRPTSETIIWSTYKNWVQSYRDLPILVNQWANVVRWEMRTRMFLRTAEFLWQEGHTAHATKEEALEETEKMINVYADFVENYMAVPVIKGAKSEHERFAGALETYSIEALMQDGKALQSGTSHFLGQNFAKAFEVQFTSKEGKLEYVWATSWGVSTRLIGALIMAHSDNNGLVLPPKLAPIQVVIVPIYKNFEQLDQISTKVNELVKELRQMGIRVKYDDRDSQRPGWKFAEYEMKGVPVRLAIGPRDLENGSVEIARRDTLEKKVEQLEGIAQHIEKLLVEIQDNIYNKALKFREENTTKLDTYEEFKERLVSKPGFILAHWDGTKETEAIIKEETKATIRCIPFDGEEEEGKCILTGKPSRRRVLFALSY
jgi:prolyl-tRNA synthetase